LASSANGSMPDVSSAAANILQFEKMPDIVSTGAQGAKLSDCPRAYYLRHRNTPKVFPVTALPPPKSLNWRVLDPRCDPFMPVRSCPS
jgi:hypothetical protein